MSRSSWGLAALSLSVLLPSLAVSIANVALPALQAAFHASFHEVQWVVIAYLVANTGLPFFAGRLGDQAGRRRVLVAGAAIFAGGSLLCGFAPTLWILELGRVLQGAGAAAMMALGMALVGDTVPKDRIGRAMGWLGTMSAIGTALGPSLGGFVTAAFGWRAVFLITVPFALAAAYLASRYLPDDTQTYEQAPAKSAPGSVDRAIAAALGMTALVSTVMMATLIVGPFYLSQTLHLDIALVGVVMSAGPIVAALVGIPAGRLVDRLGATRLSVAALGGMMAGCAGISMAPASWGVLGYVVPLVVLTAHYALFQAANNTAVMKDVPRERRGAVAGKLSLARNLGLIAGASVMGALFAAAGLAVVFLTAAGITAVALMIAVTGVVPGKPRLA